MLPISSTTLTQSAPAVSFQEELSNTSANQLCVYIDAKRETFNLHYVDEKQDKSSGVIPLSCDEEALKEQIITQQCLNKIKFFSLLHSHDKDSLKEPLVVKERKGKEFELIGLDVNVDDSRLPRLESLFSGCEYTSERLLPYAPSSSAVPALPVKEKYSLAHLKFSAVDCSTSPTLRSLLCRPSVAYKYLVGLHRDSDNAFFVFSPAVLAQRNTLASQIFFRQLEEAIMMEYHLI